MAWVCLALGVFACDSGTTSTQDTIPAQDTATSDTPSDTASADTGDTAHDTEPAPPFEVTEYTPPPESCDTPHRPLVFVHGFLAAGDTYINTIQRFASNGYCLSRMFVFDWNTLNQDPAVPVAQLDAFIDGVLTATAASQVDLAGHSAGGGVGYNYLEDADRAAKVAHYIHIGSFANDAPAGPSGDVPTLNLWSEADLIITEKGDIPGATNVSFTELDHYQVATEPEVFEAIFEFVTDGDTPTTTEIVAEETLVIRGRTMTLGENSPSEGAWVEVYALDPATGERVRPETPDAFFIADAQGRFGPFPAEANTYYEMRATPQSRNATTVAYFREPFTRSNPVVYLRTLPDPSSLVGILLGGVPRRASGSTFVVFNGSQGMNVGRDSLVVDGSELINETFGAPENNLIALFLYDANNNAETDLTPVALFDGFPFLKGADLAVAPEPRRSVTFTFNGRDLVAPNYAGDEAVIIPVFD